MRLGLDIHQDSFGEIRVGDGCRTRLQILIIDEGIEKFSQVEQVWFGFDTIGE